MADTVGLKCGINRFRFIFVSFSNDLCLLRNFSQDIYIRIYAKANRADVILLLFFVVSVSIN